MQMPEPAFLGSMETHILISITITITYIFLNCVGVFDAEDSLTHQNGLLLVAERLCGNAHMSVNAKPTGFSFLREGGVVYLGVVSHDVIKASQQAQAGTDLHVHGSVHVVEQVQGFVD